VVKSAKFSTVIMHSLLEIQESKVTTGLAAIFDLNVLFWKCKTLLN